MSRTYNKNVVIMNPHPYPPPLTDAVFRAQYGRNGNKNLWDVGFSNPAEESHSEDI